MIHIGRHVHNRVVADLLQNQQTHVHFLLKLSANLSMVPGLGFRVMTIRGLFNYQVPSKNRGCLAVQLSQYLQLDKPQTLNLNSFPNPGP